MKKSLFALLIVSITVPEQFSVCAASGDYNYDEALQKVLYYFNAQRSGDLPEVRGKMPGQNRVEWRGDSYLNDGDLLGIDLSGGWYDAGDSPKWNRTMCAGALGLYWSGAEYRDAYLDTEQMPYLKDCLKWVSDYFLKCFHYDDVDDVATYTIYLQVDNTEADGNYCAYEILDYYHPTRYIWYADKDAPNSPVVAAMSATLAGASFIIRINSESQSEIDYSDTLLNAAENLYSFANTYRAIEIKDHNGNVVDRNNKGIYGWDNEYWSELGWAALWLDKASKAKDPGFGNTYLHDAVSHAAKFKAEKTYGLPAYLMLAKEYPSKNSYREAIESQLERH